MTIKASDITHVFAVPGADSIIDFIHPATDRSSVYGHTDEVIAARYPGAVRMAWEDFRRDAAARQDTPIVWEPTTREKYWEMLEVLPPIDWNGIAFLVGEPCDHSHATGAPRYQAYAQVGPDIGGKFLASSRPITRAELRAELKAGRVR